MGDTVRKDGKDYTVSGVVEGGIAATREVTKHGAGVTESETIFLRGEDEVLGAWHAANGNQASDRQGEAQPAAQAAENASPANATPAPKKPRGVLAKKAEAEERARAGYFTPGNVIKSYSGHDRVIEYNPTTERGGWEVKVRAVRKEGDAWVDVPGERERYHATQPDAKELKAGPVGRAQSGDGAKVQTQEASAAAPSPTDFIPAPDGGLDYGEITPEMSQAMRRQAGNIRLQQGVQNSDGTGWGLAHIEANHGKQIRNAGFSSVGQFIGHVAGSFNEVLQAAKGKQLLVAVTQGRRDVMFVVQLEVAQDGDFYRVNTAFPASRDYLEKQEGKGAKILWSGSEPRSAATGQQPPYAGSPDGVSGQDAPIARGENSAPNRERAGPSAPVVEDNPPYPRSQSGNASVPASAPQGKATADTKPERITPDSAANMQAGDVVVDEDGKEYRAHAARHKWLEAHPIENGKANVSADTMVTFHLDPQSAGSYPERSHKAVFLKNEPSADGGAKPAESKPAAKPIEDFGEKLEGARKDLPPSLKEELGDEQIASLPLSKIWPADAHESIEDAAAAALAFAARQEIPAKPRVAYKVRAWVEKVKTFRTIVANMKGSLDDMERRAGDGGFRSLAPFFARVRLLAQLPRASWGRVEKVGEYPDAHRFAEGGTKTAMPFSEVMVDGKTQRFEGVGKIGPDEVDQLKALLAGEKPKAGALTAKDFEVRGTAKTGYKINRKGDPEYRALKIFTGEGAAKAALAWRDEHTADLESAWEAAKARDNVAKADVRRDENRERTGESRRNGKDVTPEMFTDAFGFRGTQFGNWVSQGVGAKSRQGLLNEAYDAMLDLAEVLGIPPKAISLNGTLGLSLGARGAGKAAAHFEPSNLVINLTKTRGAGTLAHEWFHALDNYFSRMRGGEVAANDQESYRRGNYITYRPQAAWVSKLGGRSVPMSSAQLKNYLQTTARWNDGKTLDENAEAAGWQRDPNHKEGVRPQVEQAFAELVQALNESPMAKRAGRLDKGNGNDGYWGRIIERGARSFENYVISKMAQRGWSNDFLANVRSFEEWSQIGKNTERYPYLTPQEEAPVAAAFDKLFETVETREGEDGKVLLFSRSGSTQAAYEERIDALFAGEKAALDGVRVLDRSDVVTMLGLGDGPVHLAESKVNAAKHPNMTAEVWKKIPGWMEHPAAVFDSDTVSGRLVMVAPETINEAPVLMVVEPMGQTRSDGVRVHLLQNAYDKDQGAPPFGYWFREGLGRYVDQKEFPAILNASGLQLSGTAWQNKPGTPRILRQR